MTPCSSHPFTTRSSFPPLLDYPRVKSGFIPHHRPARHLRVLLGQRPPRQSAQAIKLQVRQHGRSFDRRLACGPVYHAAPRLIAAEVGGGSALDGLPSHLHSVSLHSPQSALVCPLSRPYPTPSSPFTSHARSPHNGTYSSPRPPRNLSASADVFLHTNHGLIPRS